MNKVLAILGGLIILLIVAVVGQGFLKNASIPFLNGATATINNEKFNLMVAKTDQEKQIGLSEKKSIPEDSSMVFKFPSPDYYSFWMKNMKFPIDIIYIKDNKIVTVLPNVQPPASPSDQLPIYKPTSPADTVLEINSGLSQKYNFKEGNLVKFQNL